MIFSQAQLLDSLCERLVTHTWSVDLTNPFRFKSQHVTHEFFHVWLRLPASGCFIQPRSDDFLLVTTNKLSDPLITYLRGQYLIHNGKPGIPHRKTISRALVATPEFQSYRESLLRILDREVRSPQLHDLRQFEMSLAQNTSMR